MNAGLNQTFVVVISRFNFNFWLLLLKGFVLKLVFPTKSQIDIRVILVFLLFSVFFVIFFSNPRIYLPDRP